MKVATQQIFACAICSSKANILNTKAEMKVKQSQILDVRQLQVTDLVIQKA